MMADPPAGGGNNPPVDPPPGDPPPGDPPPTATDWFEGLPEDLKGDAAVSAYKGKPVADVVTALKDLSGKYAATAAPATPKEYKVQLPNKPDGTPADPALLDGFFTAAHTAGLSDKQLQGMLDWHAAQAKGAFDADTKAAGDAEKALKERWGDKYDERKVLTARAIETFPEGLKKIVTDGKLGSDPFFIELIHTIGEAQAEGRLHEGDPGASPKDLADRIYKTA
jgi:hypothetical protein